MPGPNQDLEKTGYSCAGCQRPDGAEVEMVFCDHCQRWYHFGCAGVTADVKDVSWSCEECLGRTASKNRSPRLEEELAKLEKEMEEERQALELEKILHNKRLEHQRKMFLLRQLAEKEKRDMELAFEKQLEKELTEKEAYRKKRDQVLKKVQEKLKQVEMDPSKEIDYGGKEPDEGNGETGYEDGSRKKTKKKVDAMEAMLEKEKPGKGNLEKKKSGKQHLEKVDPAEANQQDFRGAFCKYSTPKAARGAPVLQDLSFVPGCGKNATPFGRPDLPKKKSKKLSDVEESCSEENNSTTADEEKEEEEDLSEESSLEESSSDEEEAVMRRRPKEVLHRPTKAQLSARQFLSKKLPIFTGRLEEWPMFISAYETSNQACGFSNVENLARLQECLKGQALEVVRSRLLLPNAVPQIIEMLKMLYGRPEQLLNMLLVKVRNEGRFTGVFSVQANVLINVLAYFLRIDV